MEFFKRLVREIHRRSLWQVVGIYLVGAWIGYQVTLALTDGLGLPDWVPPLAFILFVIGLPVVTATAFVQEGGPAPGALRPTVRADDSPRWSLDPNALPDPAPAPALASPPPFAVARGRGAPPFLTWPRAFLGGVVAFALLGLGSAGWLGMRSLGVGPVGSLVAAGAIEEQERILIADFGAPEAHLREARIVREALDIDFARSTLVRVVGGNEIRDVLRRMGLEELPDGLDEELARELALRAGVNVYLTGELTPVGAGFVISTRLRSTADGETILAARETARDAEDLIPAVDRLSRHLRERTGESLRTIRRAPPLERVTTSSLQALEAYTEGRRAHTWQANQGRALEFYEEAVQVDSAFASAWRAIAAVRSNFGDPEGALEAVDRALVFQDRLAEVERHAAAGLRHTLRRELQSAISAYERALRIDSGDPTALNNIALIYHRMGDMVRAEEYFRRSLASDTVSVLVAENLSSALWSLGRFDEARETLELALRLTPSTVTARTRLAALPAAEGDYRAAEEALRALVDDPSATQGLRREAARYLGGVLEAQGRLEEAGRIMDAEGGATDAELMVDRLIRRFWTELDWYERRDRAEAALAEARALVESSGEEIPGAFNGLAWACAGFGDATCAREFAARSGMPEDPGLLDPWWHHALRGEIALAEGSHDEAIRRFRFRDQAGCWSCSESSVGRVLRARGELEAAADAFDRFLESPSPGRVREREWEVPLVHLWAARLREELGDAPRARHHYTRLLELWEGADPELGPRLDEARAALARLGGGAG